MLSTYEDVTNLPSIKQEIKVFSPIITRINLCLGARQSNSNPHLMDQWHNFQDSIIVLMLEDATMIQMESQNKNLVRCKI